MSRKSAETLTDFLVVAISPALIMLLVGSLVFFLTDVFYEGEFPGKLRFACAMFVLAAVLIARISIEEGREYASMFALPLAIVTMLSIMRYTDAGLFVVLPLVVFIWWSTDKLTWDCTVIDERKDASGEGLLQTVGLDADGAQDAPNDLQKPELLDREATTDSLAAQKQKSPWRQWIEKRRRHHTPGVWVTYFGVAAVPLFGLGGWWLPEDARTSAFFLLCVYVASALALLMTTSFLQLRRYLLQRRLPLPEETARIWLVTGGVMIAVLMVVCLMLPRPNTGYSLLDSMGQLDSRHDQRASRFGLGDEGVSDPEQDGQAKSRADDAATDSQSGQQRSQDAKQGDNPGQQGQPRDGEPSSSGNSEKNTGTNSQNKGSPDDAGARSENSATRDQQRNDPTSDRQSNAQRNTQNRPPHETEDTGRKNFLQRRAEPPPATPKPSTPPSNPLPSISLGNLSKWVYVAVIGLLVAFVLFRYWREIRDAIGAFLRDLAELWRRLFGGRTATGSTSEEPPVMAAPPARPFAAYQDPFASGWAGRLSPQQLVSYTFEALQAWAEEHHCGRQSEETPLEFALQIASFDRQVGALARNLAILYNQAAYAPGTLGPDAVGHARNLWSAWRAPTALE